MRQEIKVFLAYLKTHMYLESIVELQQKSDNDLRVILDTHLNAKGIYLSDEECLIIHKKIHEIDAASIIQDIYQFGHDIPFIESVSYESNYLQTLAASLKEFIIYALRFPYEQQNGFTRPTEYYKYVDLAVHLRKNLSNIAKHVHVYAHDYQETVKPNIMLHSLYRYRDMCYRNTVLCPEDTFANLEQQNLKTKNYSHYDFSVKKVQTLK